MREEQNTKFGLGIYITKLFDKKRDKLQLQVLFYYAKTATTTKAHRKKHKLTTD